MVALSFLGVGNYEKTRYKFKDQIVETEHFTYAVNEFIKPDKLFVIMTSKAEQTHSQSLSKLCDFEKISIPDGKSEAEFWDIFDKIINVINEGDEVVFDITHGFRSQPFIVIVLLIYLKALKNIKIKNILYGAFEAKDDNNITPVFELKSFIDLIEWSNAVKEFIDNGNMKHFKTILSEIHRYSYINKASKPSKQLLGAGTDLDKLTDAFSTIRLQEMFETTYNFNKRLSIINADIDNNVQAKPFKNLVEIIINKFAPISLAEKKIFSSKGIEAQKSIMQWYIETSKIQKAVTLAREYLVSKYLDEIKKLNSSQLLYKKKRIEAEDELGQMLQFVKKGKKVKGRKGEFAELWQKITLVRNDINHAGMNNDPAPSKKIISTTKDIVNKIISDF